VRGYTSGRNGGRGTKKNGEKAKSRHENFTEPPSSSQKEKKHGRVKVLAGEQTQVAKKKLRSDKKRPGAGIPYHEEGGERQRSLILNTTTIKGAKRERRREQRGVGNRVRRRVRPETVEDERHIPANTRGGRSKLFQLRQREKGRGPVWL